MTTPSVTSTTRAAILGQLALREWSAYELTRSMRRSVRWFWPRAESVVYAEAKRLVGEGLATARAQAGTGPAKRGRTVYTITAAGHAALAEWLATEPGTFAMQHEALLRVHLARFGTREDLLASIAWARGVADELLADADQVAAEFVAGTHLFQGEAHVRGLLFDALAGQGLALRQWALDAQREVERWEEVGADDRARRRAVARMRAYLRDRAEQSAGQGC
jgi:DNA-binding PadR family transcriptional regulator